MKLFKKISSLVLLSLILGSCDPLMVYDHFEKTNQGKWNWNDIKSFEVNITDTISAYNVYVNVRHTKEYPKNNLYIFLSLQSPNGAVLKDTLELKITDLRGKWLGEGFGSVKLVRLLYRKDVHFVSSGKYIFTLEQGMRLEEIPVTDIGVRVEEYKPLK
jgi:gliding motility-associated lipoprotein GldH